MRRLGLPLAALGVMVAALAAQLAVTAEAAVAGGILTAALGGAMHLAGGTPGGPHAAFDGDAGDDGGGGDGGE